ncbi:MAG: peroxiredoxin family protein [Limisphaerales bacterium]
MATRCAGLMMLSTVAAIVTGAARDLIGAAAPAWDVTHWINSPALRLADLRGKVVLVRWWTAPDCPYCRATAPALNEFHEKYQARGLEVLGFYHHKSDQPLKARAVKEYARRFGFKFPVAIDAEWRTLRRWWLDTGDRPWTSVSFLIDRKGVIRFIHPGGQYVRGDPDYAVLKAKIEALLAE